MRSIRDFRAKFFPDSKTTPHPSQFFIPDSNTSTFRFFAEMYSAVSLWKFSSRRGDLECAEQSNSFELENFKFLPIHPVLLSMFITVNVRRASGYLVVLNLVLSRFYGRNLSKRATTSTVMTFEMRFLHPAYPYRTRSFLLARGSRNVCCLYAR